MSSIDPVFIHEHAGFVRALARNQVQDPNLADDLEQEARLQTPTSRWTALHPRR